MFEDEFDQLADYIWHLMNIELTESQEAELNWLATVATNYEDMKYQLERELSVTEEALDALSDSSFICHGLNEHQKLTAIENFTRDQVTLQKVAKTS